MAGVEWVRWVFAGMFAALTLFYVIRLLTVRPDRPARGVDGARAVMSLGMVAMLVPSLDPLPRLGWQVLFGLAAGYVAGQLIRRSLRAEPASEPVFGGRHELHLVVGALAMVYMFAALPAGREASHGMHPAAMASTDLALPLVNWAFIGYFLVFVVRLGARLAVPVSSLMPSPLSGLVASPHLLGSSEIFMGIGMSYMLITML